LQDESAIFLPFQDTAMRRCTKAERIERTKENKAKAIEREKALKEKYLQSQASGHQF
jgi:hypothetical protein